MKKALFIILFILILIAIPATVFLVKQRQDLRQRAAPASRVYFEPSSITKNVNENITLNAMINTDVNIVQAVQLRITYNSTNLEGLTLTKGADFDEELLAPTISNGVATITVGSSTGFTGTGVIGVITFKALAETASPIQVAYSILCDDTVTDNCTQAAAKKEGGTNVLIGTEPALITITQPGGSPSPSPSASPGGPTPTPSASPSGGPSATPQPSPSGTVASTSPSPSSSTLTPSPSSTPGGPTPTPSPSPSTTTLATTIIHPANGSSTSNKRPGIDGTSFKNALIILTINSATPINDTFYANASGIWSYALRVDLQPGTYTISVTGNDPVTDKLENASSTFTVTSSGGTGGTAVASPTATPHPTATPVSGGGTTGTSTANASPVVASQGAVPITGSVTPTFILFIIASGLIFLGFATTLGKKE